MASSKCGFSYKKCPIPHKADSELQKQFIAEYTQLKKDVGEKEPILLINSVHPTQATQLADGWIRTGKTKHVGATTSRTRLNIVGAIRLGHIAEARTSQYEAINAESIINCMDKIRAKYDTKMVHLIFKISLVTIEHHELLNIPQNVIQNFIFCHLIAPISTR